MWSKVVKMIMLVILIGLCKIGYSQGVVGFFTQKQTQTQYLVQQIAALKVYAGYLKQGYKIVDGGLNTIGNIQGGHLKLDEQYFEGLKRLHPRVRHQSAAVVKVHNNILKTIALGRKLVREASSLDGSDGAFAEEVFKNAQKTAGDLHILLEQILDEGLKMTDDERLGRVNQIYNAMLIQYQGLKVFNQDLQKLEIQKWRDLKDVKDLRKIYP